MMKKIFSKRSGFTLVEIVVAFAVFAIMAAMILQILNVIMYEKKSNAEYAEKIQTQEALIVQNGRTGKYESENKTGSLNFAFGEEKFQTDYEMKFPEGKDDDGNPIIYDDGLAYYVGPNSNAGGNDDSEQKPSDTFGSSAAGSQMERMDTRISGTRGFTSVNVYNVIRDTTYSGPGVRYFFEVSANGEDMPDEMVPYAQYKLYFYLEGESTDKDGNKIKTRERANIIEAGYINNPDKKLEWTENCKPLSEFPQGVQPSQNTYNVKLTNQNCIRIGTPYITDWSNGGQRGIRFLQREHTRFYAVFEEDPNLTAKSFGTEFASQGNVTEESDKIIYKPVPILDDEGNFTGKNYINIYGAYEKKKDT